MGFSSDLRCGPAYSNKDTGASDGSDRARAAGMAAFPIRPAPRKIIEHRGDELLSAGVLRGQGAGEKIE